MQKGKRWKIDDWLESLIQVSSEKSINIFNTKLNDWRSILGAKTNPKKLVVDNQIDLK